MGKISDYAQALKSKLTDLFVVYQINNSEMETKSVTTEQIGDAICGEQVHSSLETDDKTIIGGINEVNSASLKASELRVIRETRTTNNNGTIDSNGFTDGAIPLSRTILSAYSPNGYFVKVGYYSSRYTFDIYDNSFQLVKNTAVEICIVETADLTR